MLSHRFYYFLLLTALFFLYGCHTHRVFELPTSTQKIITQAKEEGFQQQEYATQTFRLTAFEKRTAPPADTIHLYIEGDGNSWRSRHVLSNNPTPKQPLALELAKQDPHRHVIYLARPCQYTPPASDPLCSGKFWSSHRYAPEVILAFQEALTQIKEKNKNTNFCLIGFSGGASVAALLASQRQDINVLITLAGDLNHEALSQYHHTTPLVGSLNPIKIASRLKYLPQYHFSGELDKVVPPWVAEQFAQEVNNQQLVSLIVLPRVKHHQGWLARSQKIVTACSYSR